MTGDDDLRARLADIDPVHPKNSLDPPRVLLDAQIKELVMQTITHPDAAPTRSNRRRPLLAVAAAAAAGAIAFGAYWATTNGGAATQAAPKTLSLDLAPSDVMASCMQFDVALLRDMPVAFAGTVTDIAPGSVRLDVDRWYTGGDADEVVLAVPGQQSSAALDGVNFVEGDRFLLSAADGTVNGCGYSGPATAELEGLFDTAFGG